MVPKGIVLIGISKISGINVTSYYMSYIFINALGISELLSRILAACGSVDYLICACQAYFVIEKIWETQGYDVQCCSLFNLLDCVAIATGLSEKGRNSFVLG